MRTLLHFIAAAQSAHLITKRYPELYAPLGRAVIKLH